MSEDDEHQLGEARIDWRELGQFAPRVPSGRSRLRRDLGPGGSLVQDAQRAQRLRQPQRWHGVPVLRALLGAGVVLATAVLLALLAGAGWWVVLLLALGLPPLLAGGYRVSRRPTSETWLLARARAERWIAAELEGLAVSGWVLLHDRVLPGGEHRVAHLAIGPAGVFIVGPIPDTGPLRIIGEIDEGGEDHRQLYAGGLHLGVWLDTRRWELEQLETSIAAGLQDMVWTGPTAGFAVLVPTLPWWQRRRRSTEVAEIPYEWHGIEFRPLGVLLDTLTGLPSTLDRPVVASLAGVVERLCPPAGRIEEPHDPPRSNSVG